jgi:broad specificity polyphosphatase/5'/3'-nucleotidase SurE
LLRENTQTHNERFAEEANLIITRIAYNSPFEMSINFPNLDPKNIAEAIVTTIDGITQNRVRLEKAELENYEKALQIKQAEQKADREDQASLLEQEKNRIEIESQRLALLEQRLEIQKKGIEFALEIAGKTLWVMGSSKP